MMSTALVLIDIQNDYFEAGTMPLAGADQAADNARLVLDRFRSEGLPAFHIQHIATRPTATFFLPGTNGSKIDDRVKPIEDEALIIKHYPNSFLETGLSDLLKIKNITDLVICGMMTHMCVDATVRAAKDFGYSITLIGDACATKDLEINGQIVGAREVQTSFLAALNYFYSTVTSTKEYLERK